MKITIKRVATTALLFLYVVLAEEDSSSEEILSPVGPPSKKKPGVDPKIMQENISNLLSSSGELGRKIMGLDVELRTGDEIIVNPSPKEQKDTPKQNRSEPFSLNFAFKIAPSARKPNGFSSFLDSAFPL